MTHENPAAYVDQAHFRVPSDFMPRVHLIARTNGLTAAAFMRMAILNEMRRFGSEQQAA